MQRRKTSTASSVPTPRHCVLAAGSLLLVIVAAGFTCIPPAQAADNASQATPGESEKNAENRTDSQPAAEQPPDPPESERGLSATERRALKAAAQRDEPVTIEAIVIAAIARTPGRTSAIIMDSMMTAPEHAQGIRDAAAKVYPQLKERIAIATEEAFERLSQRAVDSVPVTSPTAEPAPPSTPPAQKPGQEAPRKVEAPPETEPPSPWSGEVAVSGARRSGASRVLNGSLNALVKYEPEDWQNEIAFGIDYARTGEVVSEDRLETRGRSRYDIDDPLYIFGEVEYEDDRFSGFAYQATESVGLGKRIVETDDLKVDIEGGPAFRQSRVRQTGDFGNEVLLRAGGMIEWYVSDTATFTNETSLLMSSGGIEVESATTGQLLRERSEMSNVSAFDMQIIGDLKGRISLEVKYRSDPPPGGVRAETLTKIGLVQQF